MTEKNMERWKSVKYQNNLKNPYFKASAPTGGLVQSEWNAVETWKKGGICL